MEVGEKLEDTSPRNQREGFHRNKSRLQMTAGFDRAPVIGTNSLVIFHSVAPDSPHTKAVQNEFAEFWP